MDSNTCPVRIATVVVGGGPAGLVMAYYLRRAKDDFVVLEADARIGDVWRSRWDSLRLFSTPRYASLPGWRIPVRRFPTRDEMADYLEQYAARFHLPVRTDVRVLRVTRADDRFLVETTDGGYLADRVVIATGAHQRPRTPGFASELDPAIRQLHSIGYRNASQFAPGGVLVVGAANSGTDIALDAAAAGHPTWLAGRHPGQAPVDIDARRARPVIPMVMFVFKHVLTLRTPMGRAARPDALAHGVQLVRNKLADLDAAGVIRIGRITAVEQGRPMTDDGRVPDVSTVVWCTGSEPDHTFLDLPVTGADGRPEEYRGVANTPGLYFLGLEFQFALASSTIQGLDRDARFLLRQIRRTGSPTESPSDPNPYNADMPHSTAPELLR
ncbi:MAG TPA: NAD(P)-binding domain-containing protein [Pseudonocardiaceae bacterium]